MSEFRPFGQGDPIYLDDVIMMLDKSGATNNALLAKLLKNITEAGVGPLGRTFAPPGVRLDRDLGITFQDGGQPQKWAIRSLGSTRNRPSPPATIERIPVSHSSKPRQFLPEGPALSNAVDRYADMSRSLNWWTQNHPRTTAALAGIVGGPNMDGAMAAGGVPLTRTVHEQIFNDVLAGQHKFPRAMLDPMSTADGLRPFGIMRIPAAHSPAVWTGLWDPTEIDNYLGLGEQVPANLIDHEMVHLKDGVYGIGDPQTTLDDRIKRVDRRNQLTQEWIDLGVPVQTSDAATNEQLVKHFRGMDERPYWYGARNPESLLDAAADAGVGNRANHPLNRAVGSYGRTIANETYAQAGALDAAMRNPALTGRPRSFGPGHPLADPSVEEVFKAMRSYESDMLHNFGDRAQIRAKPMAASPVGMAAQIGVPVALGALGSRTDGPLRDSLMGAAAGAGIGGFLGVPGMAVGGFLGAVAPQLQRLSGSSST